MTDIIWKTAVILLWLLAVGIIGFGLKLLFDLIK